MRRLKHAVPKLLKRDLAVTIFVGFAIAGWLEGILLVFAFGALSFGAAFAVKLVRYLLSRRAEA